MHQKLKLQDAKITEVEQNAFKELCYEFKDIKDTKDDPLPCRLQPGDTVLVQNHTKGPFDPKYVGNYHVVFLKGNQVEVQLSIGGPTEMKHIKHVKYILPADRYIKQIPDYSAFGRKAILRMNHDRIPNLH